ncbi:MAG TPA: DUF86 domain-containing protein [Candidatus Polarisedimenticolaceae bacterium]|nr:DUF86 domain-containing protein [Candidatus Polarisedimenticolaceae bacterium]
MTPGSPDTALVLRHLHALDEALTSLRAHRGRSLQDLEKDREERWIVERGLQLCAQNVLDVATHLAASAGHDVPDYASALDRLQELGVLSPEFVQRFRGIAGFRNVLVHGYLEVDLRVLHTVLEERFDDFGTFARLVRRYLDTLA